VTLVQNGTVCSLGLPGLGGSGGNAGATGVASAVLALP